MKNMKADFVFFIYVFGTMSLPWEVTTSVTINSTGGLGDTGTVRCGSEVTFMCNISTYMYSMTWSIDSVIVAQCTLLECTDTELKNTMFTFNTSTGIFTMTINPVTFATNGRVITCEDGTSSTDVTINVIVLQEQSDTTMFDSSYQDTINITVETGCVFPSASVSLHWYYYEIDTVLLEIFVCRQLHVSP
ncbi:uncharacterized protein LOC123527739 [Mercenaria mercenaria]|uniref:uncharacterized protein LOC123527739 n=1 Tax=Mercenaria mercenaria TaxID=6596 RepID=UPI00234EAE35|nr:uncharacterized protein LOC123527739 [Mercenaria mercenaria]